MLNHDAKAPLLEHHCKQCDKTFKRKAYLKQHILTHDKSEMIRKFKCNQCDKMFKFRHHLMEHERIHSGEKPFACKDCGKRSTHSGSHAKHVPLCSKTLLKLNNNGVPLAQVLAKNGISPSTSEDALRSKYKCNQCDNTFKYRYHLKKHERIHSGEKLFSCAICGKVFKHSGNFAQHKKANNCNSIDAILNTPERTGISTSTVRGLNGDADKANCLREEERADLLSLLIEFPEMFPDYNNSASSSFQQHHPVEMEATSFQQQEQQQYELQQGPVGNHMIVWEPSTYQVYDSAEITATVFLQQEHQHQQQQYEYQEQPQQYELQQAELGQHIITWEPSMYQQHRHVERTVAVHQQHQQHQHQQLLQQQPEQRPGMQTQHIIMPHDTSWRVPPPTPPPLLLENNPQIVLEQIELYHDTNAESYAMLSEPLSFEFFKP